MTSEYIQQELTKIANVSLELKKAKDDDNYLCMLLNQIPDTQNQSNLSYYEQRKDKPLGSLRYEITRRLINKDVITPDVLNDLSEAILGGYSRNVREWSYFVKCFPLYYSQFEKEIKDFLRSFTQQIKIDINYPDAKHKIVDYNGARNTGSLDAWIAIYNPSYESHSSARQLFFNIVNGELSYGLYYHPNPTDAQIVKVFPNDFDYKRLIDYFKEQLEKVTNDINKINDAHENFNISSALQKISYDHFLEASKQIKDADIPQREKIRDYYVEIPELNNKELPPKYLARKAYSIAINSDDVSVLDEMNSIEARRRIEQVNFGIIKQLGETQANNNQVQSMSKKSLNTILYGPPGTGKTYNTINRTIEIIDRSFYDANKTDREKLKERFDKLLIKDFDKSEGQIAFCTFHQSMSYEDFIEGIKPVKPEQSGSVHYEILDGIFKKICIEASRTSQFTVTIENIQNNLNEELFKQFYYTFSETLPKHTEISSPVVLKTKEGYPFELFKNTADSIVVKSGDKRTNQSIAVSELLAVLFQNKRPTYKSYEEIIIQKIFRKQRVSKINN